MKSLNYLLAEVKIEKFSKCETQHLPFLPGGGTLTGKAIRKSCFCLDTENDPQTWNVISD